MRRVRKNAWLWRGIAERNFKECSKGLNKEPTRTAASEIQLHQLVRETSSQEKSTQQPQVAIGDQLEPNLACDKVNGHSALALTDL